MTDLFFEDLSPGQTFTTAEAVVSEGDIVDFAKRFDPQYFHIDSHAAKGSAYGGLVASGFHTLSLSFRLFFDLNIWERAIITSPGFDHVKWLKPLRPGDRVHAVVKVTEARRSASKPDRGIITMRHDTFNQAGEMILSAICHHLLRCRTSL